MSTKRPTNTCGSVISRDYPTTCNRTRRPPQLDGETGHIAHKFMDSDELREDRHSQPPHLHPQFLPGYMLPIIVWTNNAAMAAAFGVWGSAYSVFIA